MHLPGLGLSQSSDRHRQRLGDRRSRSRWYRTKDVGELVAGKFLRLKGRCDDVLVLDNGENVGATEVSDRFDACRLVNHGIVFGHKKPALTALVTLNYAEIKQARAKSLRLGENFDTCPEVRKLVEMEIEQWSIRRPSI